jgi:hypothetical protein
MDEIIIISTLLKLFFGFVGLEIALLYLRRLDKRVGFEWKEKIVPALEENAVAGALYTGLRFLGLCLLIGNLLS